MRVDIKTISTNFVPFTCFIKLLYIFTFKKVIFLNIAVVQETLRLQINLLPLKEADLLQIYLKFFNHTRTFLVTLPSLTFHFFTFCAIFLHFLQTLATLLFLQHPKNFHTLRIVLKMTCHSSTFCSALIFADQCRA